MFDFHLRFIYLFTQGQVKILGQMESVVEKFKGVLPIGDLKPSYFGERAKTCCCVVGKIICFPEPVDRGGDEHRLGASLAI